MTTNQNQPKPAITIQLSSDGKEAVLVPASFLGDHFSLFQSATKAAGCRNVKIETPSSVPQDTSLAQRWETRCPLDAVHRVISHLKSAGFRGTIKGPIVNLLAQREDAKVKATFRADEIDKRLQSKGLRLYPFQKEGVRWLSGRSTALLADDMGLGKTIQVLASIPKGAAVLVVCPAVAKGVWVREVEKWRDDLTPVCCKGRTGETAFRLPSVGEIVICNYDILPSETEIKKLFSGAPVDTKFVLIADEAHNLKNYETKRSLKWKAIKDEVASRAGIVWLMTATPLMTDPSDLWSVLCAGNLEKESYRSFTQFGREFNAYRTEHGLQWGRPLETAKEGLQRVCLRRMKRDVLADLPAKTYRTVEIELDLDRDDRAECDALEEIYDLAGADEIPFELFSKMRAFVAASKIKHLLEIVAEYEEQKEPIVVFSAHRCVPNELEKRSGWRVITGSTSPEERTEIENAFQAGKLRGVACTIAAGGVAITLTRASHAIFVDLDWTPALNAQAEDRICRIGQTRGCVITHLVADTAIDQKITECLRRKQAILDQSVHLVGTEGSETSKQLLALAERDQKAREEKARKASSKKAAPASVVPRPAKGKEETENAAFMVRLAQNCDGATAKDHAGFNKFDSALGKFIAGKLSIGEGLTDKLWGVVKVFAARYKAQR